MNIDPEKLAKAANVQSLAQISSPFNMQLIQDRAKAKFWYGGAIQFDTMDNIDQRRYKDLLTWWLILHETLFYQHREGSFDKNIYPGWQRDLEFFVKPQNLAKHWENMKGKYSTEFSEYVTNLIQRSGV